MTELLVRKLKHFEKLSEAGRWVQENHDPQHAP
jgi:hypothetical protein